MTAAQPGTTTYFAVMYPGYTREWPSGLRRRTAVDDSGRTFDEAWTARGAWEYSTFFTGAQFGDFTYEGVRYVEIDADDAERVRELIAVRPRGGPFTPEGQKWLAAHPEDPAVRYLGVAPPEYDAAGRLVESDGVRYFQRLRGGGRGRPSRSGVYRRPDERDVGRDEKFDFRASTWVPTREISQILDGHRDGELVPVDVSEIRAYISETRPDFDVDEVLGDVPPRGLT